MTIQLPVVARVVGLLLALFSMTMLVPAAVGLYYGDGAVLPFVVGFALTLATGLGLYLPYRAVNKPVALRDGFVVVVMFWGVLGIFGGLPLYLASEIELSVIAAIFESMSGLTTTGATLIGNLDEMPHSILFYRQFTQWLGGMGIIVLAVAILPMLGLGGMQLYRAETPGPNKEKLTPRIASTAKALWYIYLALTITCGLAYWWAGMEPFDAVGHSFSTVAIGGFSTHDASIGYYDSDLIEMIAVLFMLISGVNYALHFMAIRNVNTTSAGRRRRAGAVGSLRRHGAGLTRRSAAARNGAAAEVTAKSSAGNSDPDSDDEEPVARLSMAERLEQFLYWVDTSKSGLARVVAMPLALRRFSVLHYFRDEEFRMFLSFMASITIICWLYLLITGTVSGTEAFVESLFHVVSIGTTTGFTSVEYFLWPGFLPVLLLFASFVGGCAGSTGGGMKVIRVLLLFKQGQREVRRLLHPNATMLVKVGKQSMPSKTIDVVWGFFATYVAVFVIMLLLMMAAGLDQETAFSAVAACLNNLGPGLGEVAANYSTLKDFPLAVLSLAMLAGRLEIFTLIVLFTPSFWRK